jgi:hypothetical protein
MIKPFEIFRVTDGRAVWIESASELEEAHARIVQLAANQPGEYVIFSYQTGETIWEKQSQAYV